jgi:zinc protease
MTYTDERVAQPYVARTYLAPGRNPGDQSVPAALTLLAEILGGGQTSILTQKLQFKAQTAVYTTAFYGATALDNASFGFVIVPSDGVSLEDAEVALDRVIFEFLEEGIDPEKLDRLKRQFRASEIYARDNVQGLANAYGAALTSGLALEDIHDWPDIVQAVTQEDIMASAKLVFKEETSVTGWLMKPEEESE